MPTIDSNRRNSNHDRVDGGADSSAPTEVMTSLGSPSRTPREFVGTSRVSFDDSVDSRENDSIIKMIHSRQQNEQSDTTADAPSKQQSNSFVNEAGGKAIPVDDAPPVKQRSHEPVERIRGPDISNSHSIDDGTDIIEEDSKVYSSSGGLSRQFIAARLVSSEIDASQRRQIQEEARQQILQEAVSAQVVEYVYRGHDDNIDDLEGIGEEIDADTKVRPANWSRFMLVGAGVSTVLAVFVVTVVAIVHRRSKVAVFTSTDELHAAIDVYIAASYTVNPGGSWAAKKYGWPIGTWDVSQIQDFSRCFDLNRHRTLQKDEEHTQNLFDADISGWNVSNALTMHGMVC